MNLLSFDLNLLRVLDALLHERSTVGAAEKIGLSQPAVSSALGRLRILLDDPLFVRHGQRIVPTDYAKSLEIPLRQTLDTLADLLSRGEGFDPSESARSFKIAGSDYFAEILMPPLARLLSARGNRIQDPACRSGSRRLRRRARKARRRHCDRSEGGFSRLG